MDERKSVSGKIAVLVIDDEPFVRRLVVKLLNVVGFRNIIEAEDGSSGLRYLEHSEVGLVMLDIKMEPMNGLDFLKTVRTGRSGASRDLPIIVLTALEDDKVLGTALALDCDGFLNKPSTPKAIAKMIQRVLTTKATVRRTLAYEFISTDAICGNKSDPMLTESLLIVPEGKTSVIPIQDLHAGVCLTEHIFSKNGHILLPAGLPLTESLIHSLGDLSSVVGVKEVEVVQALTPFGTID
ncbi:MAG: response regulator [Rhodospirillales bacterium]|nr:response regulator [Rhodospirillales bacterium]